MVNDDKQNRQQWPEEIRELGYQLWAYVHGRDASAVASALAREHDARVPVRTVQHWASAHGWGERATAELSSIAPALHEGIVADLILGAVESARLLRRSVSPDVPADERPDKNALVAALALLDRAGYSPLGRVAPATVSAPASARALLDVSALSLDELDRLERDRLERLRSDHATRLRESRKR